MPKSKTRKGHKNKVQARANERLNLQRKQQKAIDEFIKNMNKKQELENIKAVKEEQRKNLDIVFNQTKAFVNK